MTKELHKLDTKVFHKTEGSFVHSPSKILAGLCPICAWIGFTIFSVPDTKWCRSDQPGLACSISTRFWIFLLLFMVEWLIELDINKWTIIQSCLKGVCLISFFGREKTQCPPPPLLVSAKWSLSSGSGLVVIREKVFLYL